MHYVQNSLRAEPSPSVAATAKDIRLASTCTLVHSILKGKTEQISTTVNVTLQGRRTYFLRRSLRSSDHPRSSLLSPSAAVCLLPGTLSPPSRSMLRAAVRQASYRPVPESRTTVVDCEPRVVVQLPSCADWCPVVARLGTKTVPAVRADTRTVCRCRDRPSVWPAARSLLYSLRTVDYRLGAVVPNVRSVAPSTAGRDGADEAAADSVAE